MPVRSSKKVDVLVVKDKSVSKYVGYKPDGTTKKLSGFGQPHQNDCCAVRVDNPTGESKFYIARNRGRSDSLYDPVNPPRGRLKKTNPIFGEYEYYFAVVSDVCFDHYLAYLRSGLNVDLNRARRTIMA
jgi:hypothetical protein